MELPGLNAEYIGYSLASASRTFASSFIVPVWFYTDGELSPQVLSLESIALNVNPYGRADWLDEIFALNPPQTGSTSFSFVGAVLFKSGTLFFDDFT